MGEGIEANTKETREEEGILDNVRFYGSQGSDGLARRMEKLDQEWDRERVLIVSLSGLGALGLAMGFFGSKIWRLMLWAAMPLLLLTGLGKWEKGEDFVSKLGFRKRQDIEDEKYALKALRGDFHKVEFLSPQDVERVAKVAEKALQAVKA